MESEILRVVSLSTTEITEMTRLKIRSSRSAQLRIEIIQSLSLPYLYLEFLGEPGQEQHI